MLANILPPILWLILILTAYKAFTIDWRQENMPKKDALHLISLAVAVFIIGILAYWQWWIGR